MTAPVIDVPPQWPLVAPFKIACVGEAPSYEEMRKKVPLVGPAGRFYNALLRTAGEHHIGIATADCFTGLTNRRAARDASRRDVHVRPLGVEHAGDEGGRNAWLVNERLIGRAGCLC